ncbi:PH domain-containing protein [Halopiger aswanensis]|uniref:PH (Pleckstrin Homology) domain-containing protein n=1 Tax=Halopiger aswanensis TaxID=148449 RepID=A0A419WEW5_9EURY|nr:PH domain-containing protein [Halopiger aswanensis]RKD94030.1 PH (Pleckstrin Homology) domain-containing protein [Halopiger aswanensis]
MARSTPDWLHLTADEAVVWESRPHPITMGAGVPIAVLVAVVGTALIIMDLTSTDGAGLTALLGALLGLGGAGVALVRYAVWTNTRYVITSEELYKKRGIVSRDVTQFRIDRIQNTTLEQDMLGRLLGYGDLTIYTAGSGDPELTFERTPRPERANGALNDQLGELVETKRTQRRQPT